MGHPWPRSLFPPGCIENRILSYRAALHRVKQEEKSWIPSTRPRPPTRCPGAGGEEAVGVPEGQSRKRLSKASKCLQRTCHTNTKVMKYLCLFKDKLKQVTPEKIPVIEFRDEPISLIIIRGKRVLFKKKRCRYDVSCGREHCPQTHFLPRWPRFYLGTLRDTSKEKVQVVSKHIGSARSLAVREMETGTAEKPTSTHRRRQSVPVLRVPGAPAGCGLAQYTGVEIHEPVAHPVKDCTFLSKTVYQNGHGSFTHNCPKMPKYPSADWINTWYGQTVEYYTAVT